MKKNLLKLILIINYLNLCAQQENKEYYFFFKAFLTDYIELSQEVNYEFRSQIFECSAPERRMIDLKSTLQEEAETNFQRFVEEQIKLKYPNLLQRIPFMPASIEYGYMNYEQTKAEHTKDFNSLVRVNYLFKEKCPRYTDLDYSNNSTSVKIETISAVNRNTTNHQNSTSKNQIVYNSAGLPSTQEIESKMAEINANYAQQRQTGQLIVNTLTSIGNYFEQQRQQRIAFEERQEALRQQEEERKKAFYSQADLYRKELKQVIESRKQFVNQPKLKSTLTQNATTFDPLYIYFAYVPKDFDYYSENVSYPNTLNFEIKEEIDVKFSPVFAFFPYSNGQYPFIEDVKSQIIIEHFGSKAKNYNIFFFNWETSVEDVVASIKNNMNDAVNKHYFNNAIPSDNTEVVFLNAKINAAQSKDYWTGDKVKQTKKVDYWNDSKTTKKKTDLDKKTKKKKNDYWNN